MAGSRTARNYSGGYGASDLLNHLRSTTATPAACWKLVPQTSLVPTLGFTSATQDIVLASHPGVTFVSRTGLRPTASAQPSGTGIPNFEVDAIFDSAGITEETVSAGLWDAAYYEIFIVNYKALTMGELVMQAGYTGEIRSIGQMFKAEGLGLMAAASQQVVESTLAKCRAREFGDARCQANIAAFTFTGTVSSVTDRRTFVISTSQATGYFDGGKITFTSGPNSGLSMEIKSNSGTTLTLQQQLPYTPMAGNAYTIVRGCPRTAAFCESIGNKINFQGEDTIPGLEAVHHIPPS